MGIAGDHRHFDPECEECQYEARLERELIERNRRDIEAFRESVDIAREKGQL